MMLVNHRYKQEVLQKHKKHERRLGLLIGLELVFRLRVRVRIRLGLGCLGLIVNTT